MIGRAKSTRLGVGKREKISTVRENELVNRALTRQRKSVPRCDSVQRFKSVGFR